MKISRKMLIRFIVKNLFSFREETEFNLLPSKLKRLNHHKYKRNGIEILKLTALYGANGSGKSNLIRSLSLLKMMILNGVIPSSINTQKFKLSKIAVTEPIDLAIEFFAGNFLYYYSISINNNVILDEYFSASGDKQNEKLVFHRQNEKGVTKIKFFDEFEEKNQELKRVIEKDLLKPHQPLLTLLNSISNEALVDVKNAYYWFNRGLVIIFPFTKPNYLAHLIDSKKGFKDFANELMSSFNTGISNLKVEVKNIEEFFGEDNQIDIDEIKAELINNPDKRISRKLNNENEDIVIVNNNGEIIVKRLFFEHKGEKNENVEFKINEESDGTRRLLEYLPAWNNIINFAPTYIIDEIERSIHPLVIKELIEKFSKDETTKGQLIFSTHESNLLDQEIFRSDEIWFAEKNSFGSTKLYSLSDFKEHSTIDIRKGYLNGRYGAIPFLGNLQDLNWNKFHDEKE